MDIDIIKDNTLIGSLTDVQLKISRPYNEYATLTVRKSGEVIAKITEAVDYVQEFLNLDS